ncbi:Z1 domain-containing protein [Paenisporosarcina sp.]|uniref:Z1 domain-containing protein n=1 Tax=Paenisporosarcina sp. TaxID=1932001 RepID=UPI003C7265C3
MDKLLIEMLERIFGGISGKKITEDELKKGVSKALETYKLLDPAINIAELTQHVKDYMHEIMYVTHASGTVVHDNDIESSEWWKKETIQWNHYRAFEKTLAHLPKEVRKTVDEDTSKILSFLPNPNSKFPFSRLGLVVGFVQMGKTTNYTGVINKAIDTGYDIVLVLAGLTEDLRDQTQKRTEESVIGLNSDNQTKTGVGHLLDFSEDIVPCTSRNIYRVVNNENMLVTSGDFDRAKMGSVVYKQGKKYIFIIKKRPANLKAFSDWVQNQPFFDSESGKAVGVSLIMIDDESDQASINTSSKEISSTNRHIRSSLNLFEKYVYLGYTATAFANVLIPAPEHEKVQSNQLPDLFPRDFIFLLEPPSNYMGPNEFFEYPRIGGSVTPYTRLVNDNWEDVTDDDGKLINLPSSLKRSILYFLLSGTFRQLRKGLRKHHSMLIHVDPYKLNHRSICSHVEDYMKHVRLVASGEKVDNKMWNELYLLFQDINRTTPVIKTRMQYEHSVEFNLNFSYSEVKEHFVNYVCAKEENGDYKVKLMEINSDSDDKLRYENYPEGLHVIAVGGYVLSRGFTLEGLVVSYFRRLTPQVDTLLQACRWNGFHDEYRDLIRVFTTEDLYDLFCMATRITMNLAQQFREMAKEKQTPEKFGLTIYDIQAHAIDKNGRKKKIRPTATNKMRNVPRIPIIDTFEGEALDISTFELDDNAQKERLADTKLLARNLDLDLMEMTDDEGAYYWRNGNPLVIADYLENFSACPRARMKNPQKVASYIRKQVKSGKLKGIDVAFVSLKRNGGVTVPLTEEIQIKSAKRKFVDYYETEGVIEVSGGHTFTPRHISYGLSKEEINIVENRTNKSFKTASTPSLKDTMSVREERNAGMLLIYFYSPDVLTEGLKMKSYDLSVTEPYVALSLVLPGSGSKQKVYANSVYLKEYLENIEKNI